MKDEALKFGGYVSRALVAVSVLVSGLVGSNVAAGATAGSAASAPGAFAPALARSEDGSFLATAVTTTAGGRPVVHSVEGATTGEALAKAQAIPGAAGAELDVTFSAGRVPSNDTRRAEQYSLDALRVDSLTATLDLSNEIVAVVDSGVQASHPDFAEGTVLPGYDFVGGATATDGRVDPFGHGTHVAGVIAAATGNAEGIAGIASGVKILPVRVLSRSGNGTAAGVANGIVQAVDAGATVINLSIVGSQSDVVDIAVNYAISKNVVVVAAAGNTGEWGNSPSYPGAIPEVISVAAVDHKKQWATFSTHNAHVDIAAPGVSVLSLYPSADYVRLDGTSMATPHVAAAAALMRAKDASLTPARLAELLTATAIDIDAPGVDEYTGAGFLNLLGSVATAPVQPEIAVTDVDSSSARLDWATPGDGGAEITGYSVSVSSAGSPATELSVAADAARPVPIEGLLPSVDYAVSVTAINDVGRSTAASVSVTTPAPVVPVPSPATPPVIETPAPPAVEEPEPIPVDVPPAPLETKAPPAAGYRTLSSNGAVSAFGGSPWFGDAVGRIAGTAVTIASTPNNDGYWIASSSGEVLAFGNAVDHGSLAGVRLNKPVINMAVTPSGRGYWLLAQDGGVFSFGDAQFFGSTGDMVLNQPAVGMTPTESGDGYWFVAADGGIFTFGDAQFYGSMGSTPLNRPVVGMTVSTEGAGYRLVAADGGIFSFGDVHFFGSLGANPPQAPIQAMQPTPSNRGYYLLSLDGGVFTFGDADFHGVPSGSALIAMSN